MTKTLATITIALLGTTILLTGCATQSRIHFEEPAGTNLYLPPYGMQTEEQEYRLPVGIDLPQTDSAAMLHSDTGGRRVRMTLPDGTKLKGFLCVYRVNMDQVEKLAEVTFRLTEEQLTKLKSGHAVTVFGYSARHRPVYKINLGLDR